MFLIRSGSLEGYESLLTELGRNPLELMAKVGLTGACLRDPDNYLGFKQVVELLELSAREVDEPLLGLLMSRRHNSSILGDLAVYLFHQPTVIEAIMAINDYLYLHARGLSLHIIKQDEDVHISMQIDFNIEIGMTQFMQLSVGHLTNYVADLLGQKNPKFTLHLQQDRPVVDSGRLAKEFTSTIKYNRSFNGISVPSSWLNREPDFDDRVLKRSLNDSLIKLEKKYPNCLEDQVKEIICQFLPFSECSLQRVASIMSLHPRTLQDKLLRRGTNYNKILQVTRLERAEYFLQNGLSITDIALSLGFADISVFSSTFKRWTGVSPKKWQMQFRELKTS